MKDVVTVRKEELKVLREPQASGYNAASAQPSEFTDERMGGSIFTIDGVTLGLEICLDHAATTSSPATGRLDSAANIQVQLIPSAGMDIKHLQTVPGGIVFNVDGGQPHVEVYGKTAAAFEKRGNYGGKTEALSTRGLGGWSVSKPVAPRIANGMVGSVLMYGPYELPKI